jgi:hypothetical protein
LLVRSRGFRGRDFSRPLLARLISAGLAAVEREAMMADGKARGGVQTPARRRLRGGGKWKARR